MKYQKQTCFIMNFIEQRIQFELDEADNTTGREKLELTTRADELLQLYIDLEGELLNETERKNNVYKRQRCNSALKTK